MEKLFFIAIIPPQPLADQITAIKMDFANRFGSRRALRTVPHITLAPPFKLFEGKRNTLIDWFKNMLVDTAPFDISLDGFGFFPKPKHPVVSVKPKPSKDLNSLQRQLMGKLSALLGNEKTFAEHDFHPHMTVAYRDLTQHNFGKAWVDYENKAFSAAFTVDAIHLLEHDGANWNIITSKNL